MLTAKIRLLVASRANRICEYCRCLEPFSSTTFSIEHIIPRSLGGTNDLENLAFACQGCNNIKFIKIRAIDPETAALVPLFHPRQDDWANHFAWSDSLMVLLGLTPTGRATIEALKLNREEIRNLRLVLFLIGEHPPKI